MATSIYKEELLSKRRELQAAIEAIDEILLRVKMLTPQKEDKEKK